jgi:hypothetical protein
VRPADKFRCIGNDPRLDEPQALRAECDARTAPEFRDLSAFEPGTTPVNSRWKRVENWSL